MFSFSLEGLPLGLPTKLYISIFHNIGPNPVATWDLASLAKKGTCFSGNELCPPINLPMGLRLFLSEPAVLKLQGGHRL